MWKAADSLSRIIFETNMDLKKKKKKHLIVLNVFLPVPQIPDAFAYDAQCY